MLCPYCLTQNNRDALHCVNQECRKAIPPLYRKYHGGKGNAPIMVSVVGFSGHGKTVFLGSLFSFIDRQLPDVWKGFSRQGLNQEGVDALGAIVGQLSEGYLPKPTPRTFPQPSIHRLWKLPKYGDQTFVIYDPPGEAFNADHTVEKYASFVGRAKCVLFLVSPTDLKNFVADEMHRLLETYQLGLSRMSHLRRPQHLVVVYTKADLLSRAGQLSPDLTSILVNKDAQSLADVNRYFDSLRQTSALLRDFTANTLKAQNFLNLAEKYFDSVEFTVVSSTGSNPENGRLPAGLLPSRVLDPLLWVLAKEKGFLTRHRRAIISTTVALLLALTLFTGYQVFRSRVPVTVGPVSRTRTVKNSLGSVMLRRSPGKKDSPNDVVAKLDTGNTVETLNVQQFYVDGGVWEKVRYNNQEGWINQRFLTPAAASLNAPPATFQKSFDGNINDNIGVELVLQRTENTITGTGSYKRRGSSFPVQGTMEADGSFTIEEMANKEKLSGYFRGKMYSLAAQGTAQSKLEGTWSSADNSRSYPFVLVEK